MSSFLDVWSSIKEKKLLHTPGIMPRRISQTATLCLNLSQFLKLRATILEGNQQPILKKHPIILYKFLGGYLATGLSEKNRLDALLNHYEYMDRFFTSPKICLELCHKIIIWQGTEDDIGHSIVLTTAGLTDFEGELVMEYRMNELILYRMTFAIVPGFIAGLPTGQTLFIGGSQGTSHTLLQTRQAAKFNHEISPATMLIIAMQALAKVLDVPTLSGVASSRQCKKIEAENHYSTYDHLWEASGGVRNGDFFTFNNTLHEKNIELVPRHHRSRARKKRQMKHALYENLYGQWQERFAEYSREKPLSVL